MSTTLSKYDEIPESPYYVMAHDKFMSGWGDAKNKENWMLFLCDNENEAEIVLQSCYDRTDVDISFIVDQDLRENMNDLVALFYSHNTLISLMDREDCDRWYEVDGFAHLRS